MSITWEEIEKAFYNRDELGRFTFGKMAANTGGGNVTAQNVQQKRLTLANKAQLITGVKPLQLTRQNYITEINNAYAPILTQAKKGIFCSALNVNVTKINTRHEYEKNGKTRPFNDIVKHASFIPFIVPVLKNGLCDRSMDRTMKNGTLSHEIVGRAEIVENGTKKRIGVSVVVAGSPNKQVFTKISVFRLDDKNGIVKSSLIAELRKNCSMKNLHGDLTNPQLTSSIKHKSRAVNKSIRFEFENITPINKYEKMEKAVQCLSKALRVPIGIEKSEKLGEGFVFKAQEDLTKKWDKFFDDYTKSVYEFVTSYFGLPKAESTTVKKAISDDVLTHKGKVLYECESGKPIKKADWDKFVKNLEKFMNKNLKDSEKKIILNSTALSKVLNRMLQYNTFDAVKQLPLIDLNYNDKSFDWISDSVKNMQNAFGNSFSRQEQVRIEIMQQSAGLKITNIDNKMRSDIQTILIDGVKNRKSKSDVSQMLFDKMTGDNRDFKRLADTEMQNAFNNGFVREEVYNTPEGEKTYFQRVEVIDDNTCPFCRKMNGKIAVWSDTPLPSQKANDGIADFVIWEGKEWSGEKDDVCTGAFHPWCRGAWIRYYPLV